MKKQMLRLSERYPSGVLLCAPEHPCEESRIISKWAELTEPEVSVICHTYNHAKYLEDTLNGILDQKTTFPFEIILHDDASTDGTVDIVSRYAELYPRIISSIKQGVNQYSTGKRMLQITLPYAKGKYIAFCEGDDFWTDATKLQKQYDFMESNTDVALCYHDVIKVDGNNHVLGYQITKKEGYSRSALKHAPFIPSLTRFFRNVPVTWFEFKTLPRSFDICLVSYLSKYGSAAFVPDIEPAAYRLHEGGVFTSRTDLSKRRFSVDNFLYLAVVYNDEGDFDASTFFKLRAINEILFEIKFLDAAKNFVKYFFGKTKAKIKSLF